MDANQYTSEYLTSSADYVDWLEEIIGSINDGILVIDKQGVVRLINDEYTKITSVRKKDIIGRYLRDVRKGAMLTETLKDGKRRSGIYRKEGTTEYVVDMAPVYRQGEIVGAVSVCKSLTEVHYLTKELKQSREMIAKLENTFGHIYQARYTFDDIIGNEAGLRAPVNIARKATQSNLNILIQGESGTGKELLAHAIHHGSSRVNFPFVPVNCTAIPSSLLESELFGYEEGSFTNSKKGGKIGLFELAHNGTIFLDEIGELPMDLQAKLLRVLQDGRIRKIGSIREQEVDVRLICATNKNLGTMVGKQRFREDLYYRLNGVQILIPPLRERKSDLTDLINKFLPGGSTSQHWNLNEEVLDAFSRYNWPGNVRELYNALNYAVNMTDNDSIELHHLPETIRRQSTVPKASDSEKTLKEILQTTEQEIIIETVKSFGNTLHGKKQAAKKLGISLATLYNKLNQSTVSNK
ncbi:sigma-54 interaction domain-containing protein [Pseudalkalibacillus decolorationis]|uniref:sigma-54 interaction domain-containing protein n=1 Tax=Pseudalkalibacillus decolorationis TaxID=163879 RepID=UPI002147494F|nr:sigma 54-interacting transcriptional regulator [Pseudalkalibacillus decolorationis]